MLRDDVKRQVQQSSDIVALIGQHVALVARGKEFVGLCPFHDDRKPSMYVSPAKQIFKCFACGAGGDVFSFVMDYHKMAFPEALRYLAERANIKLPERGGRGEGDNNEGPSPRQRMIKANQQAFEFFRKIYQHEQHGAIARRYVASRGINDKMVSEFGIGAAPDLWDGLCRQIAAKGYDRQAFEQAGLITPRSSGDGFYDRLRHRLIFPICDGIGRIIAFGGRVMPDSTRDDHSDAKYLNSPETPLFNKSATLFGLHLAQKAIIDSRTAMIVEGYTDVIACHQAGVRNVVATLGTSLTKEHAAVLRRYCDRVIMVYDGDEAGQKAADRAVQVFFSESLDIDIAILPEKLDPADLLAKDNGLERWAAVIDSAVDALSFQFDRIRALIDATDTLAGRQRITEQYLRTLIQLGLRQLDRQRYGLVFARIADVLRMSPAAVAEAVKKLDVRPAPQPQHQPQQPVAIEASSPDYAPSQAPAAKADALTHAQRQIIGCLLNRPDLFHVALPDGRPLSEAVVPDEFTDAAARRLYYAICEHLFEHETLHLSDLRSVLADEADARAAMDMQMDVDRLTGSLDAKLTELLVNSAAAVQRHWAEQEYERRKYEMGPKARDSQSATPAGEDAKILAAIAHINANPLSKRIPRPIG